MNAAQNAALQYKAPILVFSLEMSKESLCERLLCSQARVDSSKLRRGMLDQRDWVMITKAASDIAEAPIYIDDSGAPTLMEIRAKKPFFAPVREIAPGAPHAVARIVVFNYMLSRTT